MRLLFLTPTYPPMVDGGGRYVHALAHQLAACGHQVTVVTTDAQQEADLWRPRRLAMTRHEPGAVRIVRCGTAGLPGGRIGLLAWRKAMVLLSQWRPGARETLAWMARWVPWVPDLPRALAELDGPDLVHAFNLSWESTALEGWQYARRHGLPFVVTPFAHFGGADAPRIARNNTMAHQVAILQDAAAVMALTGFERDALVRHGVSPERLAVVGAGVDIGPSQTGRAEESDAVLARHGISRPFALFIGRACADKGALDAMAAVRSLRRREGSEISLALVGQPSPQAIQYYARLSPAERRAIRLLGEVHEAEKQALLEACAMLVLPSRVESFGLVFLEAWAHGRPVIGATAGGIPSVVADGQNGLLVPYGDRVALAEAIARLVEDRELANRLGTQGRGQVVRDYTWEAVAARVLGVYERVVAASGRAGAGSSMRIAYVVHGLPPSSLGGTQVHTWTLARAMARMGHDVHIFSPRPLSEPEPLRAVREGVHIWRTPLVHDPRAEHPALQFWHTFRNRRVERDYSAFLAEARPDIVHFQHVMAVSARILGMSGRPEVLTLHDYWYYCAMGQLVLPGHHLCKGAAWGWNCAECAIQRANMPRLRPFRPLLALPFIYRNLYLGRRLPKIALFICPSEFLRQQYIGQGLDPERILVMENGLDLSRLAPGPADDELAQEIVHPHLGFLGSPVWQKGVHVLVEAFNLIEGPATLTIYGDESVAPSYVADLKAQVRRPGVRFAGQLPYDEVGASLRQLDYLVVPSLWYENSPMVIQEAYAVGTPVVASRLGAMPEKVRDGETGRLFAPGDSEDLARVLSDIIQHPELRDHYRAHIRRGPTIEEQAERLLELYEELVTRSRGDGRS